MNAAHPICAILTLFLSVAYATAFENGLGMKFVRIPAGKFTMGSPESEKDRVAHENAHEVEITREYLMGIHEVTIGQFQKFVVEENYKTDAEKDGQGGFGFDEAAKKIAGRSPKFTWQFTGWKVGIDHPVVNVSWNDAKAFCAWLSRKEKNTVRLPTEAEWEYACRAGSKTAYYHGDDPEGLALVGNVADATAKKTFPTFKAIAAKDGYVFTAPVGQFRRNDFGLFDMHGNVWEWCEDFYDPKGYSGDIGRDPTGPATGTLRVFRGGSWDRAPGRCRSAARGGNAPAYRNLILGFRVVYIP